jgi:TRAP-type C4-dicarboxylate transport system permease small subunit
MTTRVVATRDTVDRISDLYMKLSRLLVQAVSVGMFAVMVAVNGLEITSRALFGMSFSWVQEISILAAMWVYFFAYALIAKSDEYIRVDFLVRRLPPPATRWVEVTTRLAIIAFHLVVFWFGVETFRLLSLFTTSVLDWPESLFVLPIVLGSADILLTEIIRLRSILLRRDLPSPAHRPIEME